MRKRLLVTRRMVVSAVAVPAAALTVLAIMLIARDLDAAVKWASVLSAAVALAGLVVTIVVSRQKEPEAVPGPRIEIDKTSGDVTGDDTVLEAGDVHSGTIRITQQVGDVKRGGSATAAKVGDIGGSATTRKQCGDEGR